MAGSSDARPATPGELDAEEARIAQAARDRLETFGAYREALEDDIAAYARATVEADRYTAAARAAAPSSRAGQVASSNARSYSRQASILRNRLGLAREEPPAGPSFLALLDQWHDDALVEGEDEISAEEFAALPDDRKERLVAGGLDVAALRSRQAIYDDEQRASLARAMSDPYFERLAEEHHTSIEVAWCRNHATTPAEFERLFGRSAK